MKAKFTGEDRVEGASANDRQIGGSHYAGTIQHWDLIERYGVGYLEGCATKYIQRWRLKNGVQDLRKAGHYTQKLIELYDEGARAPRGAVPMAVAAQFCAEHGLDPHESAAIILLCGWHDRYSLELALGHVEELLRAAEEGVVNTGPAL